MGAFLSHIDFPGSVRYDYSMILHEVMAMADIRIAFFDIDGTLVDPATGRISPNTMKALTGLQQRGIKICVATGRPSVCFPDFGAVRFDVFCAFNGSLCYTDREIIHRVPISPGDVQRVLQNAAQIGRPVSVAVRDRLVANGWDEDLAGYYRLAGQELTVADDFEAVLEADVYQIMLGCRLPDHPAIIRGTEGVLITYSWDRAADVIPAGSGKARAIGKILEYFRLDASQALAFGDGHNDMEMLQTVGTGVAMGNAAPALKEIADHVCGPVSEDGIYRYCIAHHLI